MYSAWYAGSGQVEVYCCQVWDEITLWRMFGGALKEKKTYIPST